MKNKYKKENSLISEHYDSIIDDMKKIDKTKPKYYYQLNAEEKEVNNYIMNSMNNRINYLKYPKFVLPKFNNKFSNVNNEIYDPEKNKNSFFIPDPLMVLFNNYEVNTLYYQNLKIKNKDKNIRRIKFLPPKSNNFSIKSVKYPQKDSGDIAPGFSLNLEILFKAESLADYEDYITIITEKERFNVLLLAKREQTNLNLENEYQIKSCWVGEISTSEIFLKNFGGNGKFYLLFEDDYNKNNKNTDYFNLKNFEIQNENKLINNTYEIIPKIFEIKKDSSLNLKIIFKPLKEAIYKQTIKLVCDNMKIYDINLVNEANMIELVPYSQQIEDIENFKNSFFDIKFDNSEYLIENIKEIFIKNKTKNLINFDFNFKQDVYNQFKIEPSIGVFKNNEIKRFTITYIPNTFNCETNKLFLNILGIKKEAIRNNTILIGDNNNNNLDKFPYLQFNLYGSLKKKNITLIPETLNFPCTQRFLIKKEHFFEFILYNENKSSFEFKIFKNENNDNFFNSEIIQLLNMENENIATNNNGDFLINGYEKLKIIFSIICDKPILDKKLKIFIKFKNENPIIFETTISFYGPSIKIKENFINFGVVKTYSKKEFQIEVENLTEIDEEVIITRKNDKYLNFENLDKEELDLNILENYNLYKYYSYNEEKIEVDPFFVKIPAFSKKKISLILNSSSKEILEDKILVKPRNSPDIELDIKANVQEVNICLNKYEIHYNNMYCHRIYTIKNNKDPNIICLRNLGNIGSKFKFIVPTDIESNKEIINFLMDPIEGYIKPKSEVFLKMKIEIKYSGKFKFYFKCFIEELNEYIGFYIFANVQGVNIRFLKNLNIEDQDDFEKFELSNIKINEPKEIKFYLKNYSGINTYFRFYLKEGELSNLYKNMINNNEEDNITEFNNTLRTKTLNFTTKTNLSKFSNASNNKTYNLKLLKTNKELAPFCSDSGKTLYKKKLLEKNAIFYLKETKGIAFTIFPLEGNLNGYKEKEITLTFYNEIPGYFNNEVLCDIKGLNTFNFKFNAFVHGSPLVLMDQVGIVWDEPIKLVFESQIWNSKALEKKIVIQNRGTYDFKIIPNLYEIQGKSSENIFKLNVNYLNNENKYIFNFNVNNPKVLDIDNKEENKFYLNNNEIIIPSKSFKEIIFCYNSEQIGEFSKCIKFKPFKIGEDLNNNNDLNLEPLSFQLHGRTVKPYLRLLKDENNFDMDNKNTIISTKRFYKYSVGESKKDTKCIILKNYLNCKVIFNLYLEGPFIFTDNNDKILSNFMLLENEKVKVKISFIGFKVKDFINWPLNNKVFKKGELIIKYINDDFQVLKLEGVLCRPILNINIKGFDNLSLVRQPNLNQNKYEKNIIDFGTINIDNYKTKEFFLSNLSYVEGNFKIIHEVIQINKNLHKENLTSYEQENWEKTDNPEVFSFEKTEGFISGYTNLVNKMPKMAIFNNTQVNRAFRDMKPFQINIRFQPQKNILYKSKFRIICKNGIGDIIYLKGRGSYEENIKKY